MPRCIMTDHPEGLNRDFPFYEVSTPLWNVCPYCRTRPGMGETVERLGFAGIGHGPTMNQAEWIMNWQINFSSFQERTHAVHLPPRNPSIVQRSATSEFPIPLPQFVFKKSIDPTCTICLDLLDPDNPQTLLVITSCGHIFHNNCINNYIESNYGAIAKKCPNCKVTVIAGDGEEVRPPIPLKSFNSEIIVRIESNLKKAIVEHKKIEREREEQRRQTQVQSQCQYPNHFPPRTVPNTILRSLQNAITWGCQICGTCLPPSPFNSSHERFHCSACRIVCRRCILEPCRRGGMHLVINRNY